MGAVTLWLGDGHPCVWGSRAVTLGDRCWARMASLSHVSEHGSAWAWAPLVLAAVPTPEPCVGSYSLELLSFETTFLSPSPAPQR